MLIKGATLSQDPAAGDYAAGDILIRDGSTPTSARTSPPGRRGGSHRRRRDNRGARLRRRACPRVGGHSRGRAHAGTSAATSLHHLRLRSALPPVGQLRWHPRHRAGCSDSGITTIVATPTTHGLPFSAARQGADRGLRTVCPGAVTGTRTNPGRGKCGRNQHTHRCPRKIGSAVLRSRESP